MPRTNTEARSNLPKYDIKPSESFYEYLLVRCPREECSSHQKNGDVWPFLVHKRTWVRPLRSTVKPEIVLKGRPCPYCCKVSAIR